MAAHAILLRNMPEEDLARIRRACQVRGLTYQQYFAALSRLHEALLTQARGGRFVALNDYGLEPVEG